MFNLSGYDIARSVAALKIDETLTLYVIAALKFQIILRLFFISLVFKKSAMSPACQSILQGNLT
jgi:hypothetical protein